ncbi:MAG: hypothetical protein EOM76_08695 [Sphingobacteriia bacterium]|nr:hypothetical protein [Sphingobacteriia bacterium]
MKSILDVVFTAFIIILLFVVFSAVAFADMSTYLEVKATAYCPCKVCCGANADGITATGRDAFLAGVATDPEIIPLGSRVDIPFYNRGANKNGSWILADDTGLAIKGKRVDVRFKTHKEAVEWGVKNIIIRIWEK